MVARFNCKEGGGGGGGGGGTGLYVEGIAGRLEASIVPPMTAE